MLNNYPYHVRQLFVGEKISNFFLEAKFGRQSYAAFIRGNIAKIKGKVIENANRPLLVDASVDWLIQAGAAVELISSDGATDDDFSYNPLFSTASALGFRPHWKFLNPPVGRKTRLRLQTGSRLVLEQNTLICKGTYISVWPGKALEIGRDTIIGHECYLNTKSGLKIGRNTIVGQGSRIMDYDGHPIFHAETAQPLDRYGGASAPITIGDNVWIGFGAVIMKGVQIGSGSIIATNSWVTQNVKPNSFVAGSPARLVQENVSWKRF